MQVFLQGSDMRLTVLVLFTVLGTIRCSKILVVFPMSAPSHYILGNALARGLAEAGHEVTMVSPFEDKQPPKGYTNVVLEGLLEERNKMAKKINMFEPKHVLLNLPFMNFVGNIITENALNNTNMKKLLNSNKKFDVIILEQFVDDALRGLQHHYKAPLILFSTVGANRWVNPIVANPAPPSYVPDIFLSYSSDMTFFERTKNFLFGVMSDLNLHLFFFPQQNKIMKKYFPDAPDLRSLMYKTSLILLNEHESVNFAVPHTPNMISIGGFHVKPPKKLPKDLQDFLDGAKEGVIYFSMGSNLVPSQMPEESKQVLLKALGSVKQRVLWKWDEDLPEAPSNFKISKWFPQQDLLAHPNVKLFITHGGLLSTTETIYHGVPVLALPIFGDQRLNAARAAKLGYGLTLPFLELTSQTLSAALDELLHNPKYKDNAKLRSKLLHDRPMKPMDTAVYWTEYVIRYNESNHLKVGGLYLPWYQYLLLDVIAYIVIISLAVLYMLFIAIRKLCCSVKEKQKVKKS